MKTQLQLYAKDVESTINMIELLNLLKKTGEEFFELEEFHPFYKSLTEQEKQLLPKYDKLTIILDKISSIPTIKVLNKLAPEEYRIINPPRPEEYDRYYSMVSKKDVHHKLEQLCRKYMKYLQEKQQETQKQVKLIEESMKNSIKDTDIIRNEQDFFDYLFIAMAQKGINSLNKMAFLNFFTPNNHSLLSLKLYRWFDRVILREENIKQIVDDYIQKSIIYSPEEDSNYFYIIPRQEREESFFCLNPKEHEVLDNIIDQYLKAKLIIQETQNKEPIHR